MNKIGIRDRIFDSVWDSVGSSVWDSVESSVASNVRISIRNGKIGVNVESILRSLGV